MIGRRRETEIATLTISTTRTIGGITASRRHGSLRTAVVVVTCILVSLMLATIVPAANAAFGIQEFKGSVIDESDNPFTQAGGHPFEASATIKLNTASDDLGGQTVEGQFKDVLVDLPPGFVGDPTAIPRCPDELLDDPALLNGALANCPPNTQIGVVELFGGSTTSAPFDQYRLPVYNVEPAADEPVRIAFNYVGVVVTATAELRTGADYGLTVKFLSNNQTLNVREATLTIWGVPADPVHNPDRGIFCNGGPDACLYPQDFSLPPDTGFPPGAPERPFLTNPTNCSAGPLTTTLHINAWHDHSTFHSASFDHDADHGNAPMAVDNCGALTFEPDISVQPTSTKPDSPTGLEVELSVPQSEGVDELATAHLKRTTVTLPQGMAVSPSAAHGLGACSPAQIGIDDASQPSCPASSRIGTVEVDTPLLDETMSGEVYLATQNANPFNSLLAMYIVVRGPGVLVKLPGRVDPDPVTGQLRTTFDDNPQLPFSSFRLRFKGGPTAPLVTPPDCGTHTVESEFSPWSAADPDNPTSDEIVSRSDSFTIDCPGSAGFSPSFSAGTLTLVGGSFSPMAVRIDRPDRHEILQGVSVVLPTGLLARIRGVALCPTSVAGPGTPGTCPASSRIGSVIVGAGPGANPFFVTGDVYLTEGYKGGPYGLSVQVRAKAGPFDLGMVKVRQAIYVDPVDAHLTVVSDPVPTILQGIPLRIRSVRVDVDRPGFTINPTSCAAKQIRGTLRSTKGTTRAVGTRFQVGDCAALPLRPRLAMRLTGRRQARDGGHPGLRAILTQSVGQAGIRAAKVKLPLSLALDPDNAQGLCEYEDGLKVQCPASSIIGRATAISPVLNRPLTGPVYFVKNVRIDKRTGNRIRTLPALLIPLRGEVAIDLRATSNVQGGKLISTFPTVPDAPVSKFSLSLKGGRGGILVVTSGRNLCRGRHVANLGVRGHNNRLHRRNIRMKAPCAGKAKRATGKRANTA